MGRSGEKADLVGGADSFGPLIHGVYTNTEKFGLDKDKKVTYWWIVHLKFTAVNCLLSFKSYLNSPQDNQDFHR